MTTNILQTPDVPTPNCAPANGRFSDGGFSGCPANSAGYRYSAADQAMGFIACGIDCADARNNYHAKFTPGQIWPDSGLGGTPVIDSALGDLRNAGLL